MRRTDYIAEKRDFAEERRQMHPAWRGLGFLLVVLMPVLAVSASIVFIETAIEKKWPIYWPLIGYAPMPQWVWNVPGLNSLAAKLAKIPNLLGYVVFSAIFLMVLYTLLSLFYSILYRSLGVGRYTPVDVKRPRVKTKRYRR